MHSSGQCTRLMPHVIHTSTNLTVHVNVLYILFVVASPPGKPVVTITTEMATIIKLHISVDYMPVSNYTFNVTWEKLSPCSDSENGYIMNITAASTVYVMQTITGLDEGSNYNIIVTATNVAGNATSDPITATTIEAGNILHCTDLHKCYSPYY